MRNILAVQYLRARDDLRKLEGNVVDEEKKAGVKHIVKLSGTGLDPPPAKRMPEG